MDYLQKIRSSVAAQVHSVAAQVNLALPGNPILREYTVGQQVASAGPGLCWKIYSATRNSTKQEVSVWIFEKKQMENWLKVKREEFPEILKRGVSQLTRLMHPRILRVERALEESRDCFAFCTEPVFASLANCFNDFGNMSSTPKCLKDFSLESIEIRHGLFQLSEALAFLHNDTKMVHANISPSSIIINKRGDWKLASFDFCIVGAVSTQEKVTFEIPNWSRNSISALCPDLDYVSPELVQGDTFDYSSDIFSLGMLAITSFNNGKSIMESQNSFACYRKNLENLRHSIPSLLQNKNVPDELQEALSKCLNPAPEQRIPVIQFTKSLPNIIPQFPLRVQLQKIYPHLAGEFGTPILIPFILESVFIIVENSNSEEFVEEIMPSLVNVFPIQTPYQIGLLLLNKVDLFLKKMPTAALKQHLIPLIFNSLSNESAKIQELCLLELPRLVKYVDREQMHTQFLPKLLRMVLEAKENKIRVQTIACLAKLLNNLEPWMVADQLLPSLPKVNSKDPGVLMAVLGAKSVIPFLVSTSIEASLNLQNFNQFIDFIHRLLDKMTTEHKNYLGKLSASQEEQREVNNFIDYLNNGKVLEEISNEGSPVKQSVVMDLGDLDFLVGDGNTTKKNEKENTFNLPRESFLPKDISSSPSIQQKATSSFISPPSSLTSAPLQTFKKEEEPSINFDIFSPSKTNLAEQKQQNNQQKPSLDFLAEFLPPPTISSQQHQKQSTINQQQTFKQISSFPSLPIPPNNNSIPIQRRMATDKQKASNNDDPSNSLISLMNQQPKENINKKENGDQFDYLFR
uniref:Protein kinase domain-containing protein n=1 Tax=Meloidogyne hapla TaxID=6305 RepID=A0A1I8BM45_MELHA